MDLKTFVREPLPEVPALLGCKKVKESRGTKNRFCGVRQFLYAFKVSRYIDTEKHFSARLAYVRARCC